DALPLSSARHPALIAMETATLAGIAPGRVVLGLGTGVRRWIAEQMRIPAPRPPAPHADRVVLVLGSGVRRWVAEQMRIPAPRPLATLAECVEVIRRLWAGERVTHE